ASHGCADRDSRSSQFANTRIAQSIVAELFPKSAGLTKIAAARPNPLADIDDGFVSLHLLAKRLHPGINIGDLAQSLWHASSLQVRQQNTWSRTVEGEGSGLSLANRTASSSHC